MDLHNYADTQKIAVTTLRGWKKDALSIYRAVASHVAQLLPGDIEEKIDKYHESNNKEIKENFQKKKMEKCLSVRCHSTFTPEPVLLPPNGTSICYFISHLRARAMPVCRRPSDDSDISFCCTSSNCFHPRCRPAAPPCSH
jgi:hypothetical protein